MQGKAGRLVVAMLAAVATVLVVAEASIAQGSRCEFMTRAVKKENRAAKRLAVRLSHNPNYTVRKKTFTPKIRRTRDFDGYGRMVLPAPKGTAPVVGAFKLRGAERCSIEIREADVALRHNAYVLRFKAPGEQGNPGRITILLVSV